MYNLCKLSEIFCKKCQLLRPGESSMSRKTAIEVLSNLRDIIIKILDMDNNLLNISYNKESKFLLEFLNSLLSGNYFGLDRNMAKKAIGEMGPILNNYISSEQAIKAIDWFDKGGV